MPDETTFILSRGDKDQAWTEDLLALAREACDLTEQRLGLKAPRLVRLTTFGSTLDFHDYLDSRPHHVVAVARPGRGEIVVLRPKWNGMARSERIKILVHEFAHLIVGAQVQGNLPDWLNEGLAMMTAHDRNHGDFWQLNMAGTFGALIPLEQLQHGIYSMESKSLAYAQSLSLTQFVVRQYDGGADPGPLVRALADPYTGPRLVERFHDSAYLYTLENQWKASQRSLWTFFGAISGFSSLMIFASGLALLAWWRKRRMAMLKRERFADEDARDEELRLGPLPCEYGAGHGDLDDPDDLDIEDDEDWRF